MATIQTIRKKLALREYELAIPHFFEEMANDNLSFDDIQMAINNGVINRKFTREPRGTRYEVVGKTKSGREIAIICRVKSTGKILLITTYALCKE